MQSSDHRQWQKSSYPKWSEWEVNTPHIRVNQSSANLGHYAWFLPRDATRKRDLCCCPVSVYSSVTFVYCIQMAEDIVKLFSRPFNSIILVFYPKHRYPIPREPLHRGHKIHGVGQICDFWLKLTFISNTVRDRPLVAIGCVNRKS